MIAIEPACCSFGAYLNSSTLLIKICQNLTILGRPCEEILEILTCKASVIFGSNLIILILDAK